MANGKPGDFGYISPWAYVFLGTLSLAALIASGLLVSTLFVSW